MVRIVSAVLTALLLSLGLVGCGSGDSEKTARDEYVPLTKANFAQTVGESSGGDLSVHMSMDMDDGTAEFDMVTSKGTIAMKGVVTMDDQTGEMILVDNKFFMREEGDAKYFTLPPQFSDQLEKQFATSDPRTMARDLRKGLRDVTYVDDAKIDGDTFHRYTATLKLKFLARKFGLPADQVKQLKDFTYTFWLDDDNLMRRVEMKVMGKAVTVDLTNWGEKVDIKAPPASQVEAFPGS